MKKLKQLFLISTYLSPVLGFLSSILFNFWFFKKWHLWAVDLGMASDHPYFKLIFTFRNQLIKFHVFSFFILAGLSAFFFFLFNSNLKKFVIKLKDDWGYLPTSSKSTTDASIHHFQKTDKAS